MAETCLDMGFYLSIAGPVTFPKAFQLQEVVRPVPLERLLIETDAPYLAPQPGRGHRNEPAYVAIRRVKSAPSKALPLRR
jgi:TatD DNase family protein